MSISFRRPPIIIGGHRRPPMDFPVAVGDSKTSAGVSPEISALLFESPTVNHGSHRNGWVTETGGGYITQKIWHQLSGGSDRQTIGQTIGMIARTETVGIFQRNFRRVPMISEAFIYAGMWDVYWSDISRGFSHSSGESSLDLSRRWLELEKRRLLCGDGITVVNRLFSVQILQTVQDCSIINAWFLKKAEYCRPDSTMVSVSASISEATPSIATYTLVLLRNLQRTHN
ncbi:hypothetical protein C8R43DRAFT_946229 [Mycena crocata]|nr:hypothetical protein C8R43DRAFT_946229 [Mycena crocata]